MARSLLMNIRVSADERAMFDKTAQADGVSVSELMRKLMTRHAYEQRLPDYARTTTTT